MRNNLPMPVIRGVTPLLLAVIIVILPVEIRAQGEVVDRVVAVVGNHIITLSDIRIEKAMREILGEPAQKNDRELLDEGTADRAAGPIALIASKARCISES